MAALVERGDTPTPYGDATIHTRNIVRFADDLREAPGGGLDFIVPPADSLDRHEQIKEVVRSGQGPIGEFLLCRPSSEDLACGLAGQPFLATSCEDAPWLWSERASVVADLRAEEGLVPRSSVPWSAPRLHTDGPVEGVDGLAGLRFRARDAPPEEFARLVGASPTRPRPHIGRSPRHRSSSPMGEVLLRSRMAGDLLARSAPRLDRAPGHLLHADVPGCTISAAVSGSRVATTTTTGRSFMPGCSRAVIPSGW